VTPFQFGMPTFDVVAIVTMTLVMIVVMIESTGMFLAVADMTGKRMTRDDLARGLRTDGLGTLLGGVFKHVSLYVVLAERRARRASPAFAAASYAWPAASSSSRWDSFRHSAHSSRRCRNSSSAGAGIVMFGMVTATGIRILADVDYKTTRHNLFIVAISIGFG
jgi:NCS2 family nucleobase:cation symporter-2